MIEDKISDLNKKVDSVFADPKADVDMVERPLRFMQKR